jgi:hypothetical protein
MVGQFHELPRGLPAEIICADSRRRALIKECRVRYFKKMKENEFEQFPKSKTDPLSLEREGRAEGEELRNTDPLPIPLPFIPSRQGRGNFASYENIKYCRENAPSMQEERCDPSLLNFSKP